MPDTIEEALLKENIRLISLVNTAYRLIQHRTGITSYYTSILDYTRTKSEWLRHTEEYLSKETKNEQT